MTDSVTPARKLAVTGASGFVGAHVRAAAQAGGALDGWEIHAAPETLDLRDARAVHDWIVTLRPDAVLHLAAQSFVPRSFDDPRETFDINLIGTLHLLQALKAAAFTGRMIFVSSGDVYGQVDDADLPVTTRLTPRPRNPYAVSKIAAEQLCLQWHRTEGLDVVIARPFNHVGPGQAPHFVVPALAHQVVAIATGSQPPVIEAGDIDTTRDFTDVRDVVAAYAAILAHGHSGETYLIASGIERTIRSILMEMCHIEAVTPTINQDPLRLRPAEQRRMVADNTLLREHTGWTPSIAFANTLRDILHDIHHHNRHGETP